jgi:hypothetical protein
MKNVALLMTFLCLGLWISCSRNSPTDTELLEMPTIEKWACLKKGMSKDSAFEILGAPQSLRNSETNTVYTFDCFLCTATFDSLKQLKTWHGPKKRK